MHTINYCTHCGKQIRFWITLCEECRDIRNYHAAIVSTNKKRLQKTLQQKRLDRERLNKIETQSNNIIAHWYDVLEITNK